MQAEYGELSVYEPFGYKMHKQCLSTNPLYNKVLYGFGDSLVYGHYSGEGMLDSIANECGMNYSKYAVNGRTVRGTGETSIYYEINNAPSDVPDFVVLDGMTNDAYDEVADSHLGALTNGYNDTYDISTFYGSLENIFKLLRTKYKNANIVYVIPHKMPTRTVNAQEKLYEAVVKTCKKWAIPTVDIYNGGQINTNIDGMRNQYSYNNAGETSGGNGTHLTGEGYKKWHAPMIESKMKELV